MTSQEFERMLSARPKFNGSEAPCLRDMIFDYCCGVLQDVDKANDKTKQYTDQLYSQFVNRTA